MYIVMYIIDLQI